MIKKIAIAIAILFFAWAGLTYYFLRSSSIETLMICSTNPHVFHVPESLCKFYTLHFRGTKQDIAELESTSGLAFVFPGKKMSSTFMDFLVKKGININKVSPLTGATPLTVAVVENKPGIIKYLLAHGADPSIKTNDPTLDGIDHLTPLQVAQRIEKKSKKDNRAAIIKLLKEYSKNN